MPSTGGEPRQLTFYPARGPLTTRWGYDNQVYGWSADGARILFRSHRDGWALPITRLYTVAATGGPAEPLPMPESGAGTYAPDGKRVVYSPRFRDFRSEKRYGGGQANDLFIFDLASHDATRITDHPRADRDPMWIGGTIYFNSDRNGTFNLYAYDVAKKTTTPVTSSTTWDVRWPSEDAQAGRIVYESERRAAAARHEERQGGGDRHHGARRWPGAAAQPHPGRHAGPRRRAEPERASGRCSRRAATSSPRRSRRGRRAT